MVTTPLFFYELNYFLPTTLIEINPTNTATQSVIPRHTREASTAKEASMPILMSKTLIAASVAPMPPGIKEMAPARY
jgi:hypothetical protein